MDFKDNIDTAANWLRAANGLLVTAGAGMGVDSGLPDFRGTEGLWRAYPALKRAKLSFEDMANPMSFITTPTLAWGFYGHRLALYRETVPHEGFNILSRWSDKMEHGAFVFTSNVDGQFQKAGFALDRVAEVHGTIHSLQCTAPCEETAWDSSYFEPTVNEQSGRLVNALPVCPNCGKLARPNILMFWDHAWVDKYSERQLARLASWIPTVERLVVIELGAGCALPTVRRFSEQHGPRVIRINPREDAISSKFGVGIPCGAQEALKLIDERLSSSV